MISITEKENNCASLSLEGDLTIYAAEKFSKEMDECLNKYQRIDVDMSNVNELDTSCYQVLLRAKLQSLKSEKEFNIGSFSDESQQVFDLYNLNSVFSCLNDSNQ